MVNWKTVDVSPEGRKRNAERIALMHAERVAKEKQLIDTLNTLPVYMRSVFEHSFIPSVTRQWKVQYETYHFLTTTQWFHVKRIINDCGLTISVPLPGENNTNEGS